MPYIDNADRLYTTRSIDKFIQSLPGFINLPTERLTSELVKVVRDFALGRDNRALIAHYHGIGFQLQSYGELNFFLTKVLFRFVMNKCNFTMSYTFIALFTGIIEQIKKQVGDTTAEVAGTLENVKQEFYARAARKYEDGKIRQNGDIPEYALLG